jgi:hypothetical protein
MQYIETCQVVSLVASVEKRIVWYRCKWWFLIWNFAHLYPPMLFIDYAMINIQDFISIKIVDFVPTYTILFALKIVKLPNEI